MSRTQFRSCHQEVEAGTDLSKRRRTLAYLPLLAAAIRRGQHASFEIRGSCMWPALKAGDRVDVGPLLRAPHIGDVLVCYCGERAVAHRVVECTRDANGVCWVRCRGDAALELDAPQPASDVLGVVEHVLRAGECLPLGTSVAWWSRMAAPLRAAAAWLRAGTPR